MSNAPTVSTVAEVANADIDRGPLGFRPRFAVFCDYASTDGDKISVFGIFNQIRPPYLPFGLAQMFVATVYESPASRDELAGKVVELGIEMYGPDQTQLFAYSESQKMAEAPEAAPGAPHSINHIWGIGGFVFPSEGKYECRLFLDQSLMANIPLYVKLQHQEPA
jgi:hypothetical protein